jgi:hypothetical protein
MVRLRLAKPANTYGNKTGHKLSYRITISDIETPVEGLHERRLTARLHFPSSSSASLILKPTTLGISWLTIPTICLLHCSQIIMAPHARSKDRGSSKSPKLPKSPKSPKSATFTSFKTPTKGTGASQATGSPLNSPAIAAAIASSAMSSPRLSPNALSFLIASGQAPKSPTPRQDFKKMVFQQSPKQKAASPSPSIRQDIVNGLTTLSPSLMTRRRLSFGSPKNLTVHIPTTPDNKRKAESPAGEVTPSHSSPKRQKVGSAGRSKTPQSDTR